LDTLSPQSSDVGLCHGDLHPGNARFADDGRPTLYDFECCGYGWRAYDLAVFLWNSYGERRPRRWRESRWNAFLSGYRSIRPLPAGIDSHLADLMAARQIWLTGLDFAGQSGYPPQWIGPGLLRSTLKSIGDWRAEFPSQHVTS
jgi:Ser/Thr protein kinase RdoA (MazF antagonist)